MAEGVIWSGLQHRETPLLTEQDVTLSPIDYRIGQAASAQEPHERLRFGWQQAESIAISAGKDQPYTVSLTTNQAHYWLFDLGRGYTCQGWVDITGAAGGELLAISYADKFRDGELVLSDPATYCRVRLTDSFTLRPGQQTIEPFHMRGGRFVLFQLVCVVVFVKRVSNPF